MAASASCFLAELLGPERRRRMATGEGLRAFPPDAKRFWVTSNFMPALCIKQKLKDRFRLTGDEMRRIGQMRAAFLLHDVFGMSFDEVSDAIGRKATTCRKLAGRARTHIRESRPRFPVTQEHGLELAAAFFIASRSGDLSALCTLLAESVVVYADGGGKVPASMSPAIGFDASMKLFRALARYFTQSPSRLIRYATVDGLPGFITVEAEDIVQTTALQIESGKIVAIYVTRNPEKLRHLADKDVEFPTPTERIGRSVPTPPGAAAELPAPADRRRRRCLSA
jgi:hypothetical protein